MNLRKFLRSFRFAFEGLCHVAATEQNMRVHLAVGAFVIAAGFFFRIEAVEWAAVILCIGMVLAAECVNSAVERLADRVSPEEHFLIRHAKDAAAAGVLLVAGSAALVGLIVFLPEVWEFFTAA